jgi:hypothetical protein
MHRRVARARSLLTGLILPWATGVALPQAALATGLFLETDRPATLRPLATVTLKGASAGTVVVEDGQRRPYFSAPAEPGKPLRFSVGGAAGKHTVKAIARDGRTRDSLTFDVAAATTLDENTGRYAELFKMSLDTMNRGMERGGQGSYPVTWRGKTYRAFVTWVLDQANTMKGMLYFSPHARDMVDVFRETQRADGMVWSFISKDPGPAYYDTVYGHLGYVLHDGGSLFVRQPNENHVEYEFVNMIFQAWKATGDDAWMARNLDAGARALEYGVTDPVRWSPRFRLLKRPYTVDSWDFQVNDDYTVKDTVNPTMTFNPEKTKFGVFFGDNTGYMQACERLAEMLERAGRGGDADRFRKRAREIANRLTEVSWNGRFFRHFLDEDPSVKRDLGVDEATQIAQGNAYSLNRPIAHKQAAAIINAYQDLRGKLPPGSPGEWYAIYPPFEKGFGGHNDRWQYMNGGVAGHAAGELARGALAHGFERYGVSVLDRSHALARSTDGKIHFAYTGAFEPAPPPATFAPVDLRRVANMDIAGKAAQGARPWMEGEEDNDLRGLPAGQLKVGDAWFDVIDPVKNRRRAVVAVSMRNGFGDRAEVKVGRTAGAVYLLHTSHRGAGAGGGRNAGSQVAGEMIFHYEDGVRQGVYLERGKHLSGWWFPELESRHAGVAWTGKNPRSASIGLTWAAIENPRPEKKIRALSFEAPVDGGVYAVAGVTLADRMPHEKPAAISYGGPDNWAGANMMAALVEGLAGIRDVDRAMGKVEISPRWPAAGVTSARVSAHYPASGGYAAYSYQHRASERRILMTVTGSGRDFALRVLLPDGDTPAKPTVKIDGREAGVNVAEVERSRYALFTLPAGVHEVQLGY